MASMIDTLLLSVAVSPLFKQFLTVATPAQITIQNYLGEYQQGLLSPQQFNQQVVHYLVEEGGGALLLTDMLYQLLIVGAVIILFWFCRNATPGKMLLNMEIVDAKTGEKPTLLQWLLRYVGYVVAIAPLMLGFLWILWDKKRQGWHDKMAGTVVILKSHKDAQ